MGIYATARCNGYAAMQLSLIVVDVYILLTYLPYLMGIYAAARCNSLRNANFFEHTGVAASRDSGEMCPALYKQLLV